MSWGYSPVDFWHSHPIEFWWIAEQKRREADNVQDPRYCGMSKSELRDRYAELEEESNV